MLTTEYRRTRPAEPPEGEGWRCIHSGCSPDGERWWLYVRTVRTATPERTP